MPSDAKVTEIQQNTALLDLGSEERTEPMPPIPYRLVADIDTPFVEQVLDVAKRQREPDVQHHRQPDDFTARFEIAKWIPFGHFEVLQNRPARLKSVCPDSAASRVTEPKSEWPLFHLSHSICRYWHVLRLRLPSKLGVFSVALHHGRQRDQHMPSQMPAPELTARKPLNRPGFPRE